MPTTSSIHFIRERVRPRTRFIEPALSEQDQYLEALSQRLSKRTGLPLESARKQVEAVAISARKRHDSPLA